MRRPTARSAPTIKWSAHLRPVDASWTRKLGPAYQATEPLGDAQGSGLVRRRPSCAPRTSNASAVADAADRPGERAGRLRRTCAYDHGGVQQRASCLTARPRVQLTGSRTGGTALGASLPHWQQPPQAPDRTPPVRSRLRCTLKQHYGYRRVNATAGSNAALELLFPAWSYNLRRKPTPARPQQRPAGRPPPPPRGVHAGAATISTPTGGTSRPTPRPPPPAGISPLKHTGATQASMNRLTRRSREA